MTTRLPVTLQEFRDHLNVEDTDIVDDAEMFRMLTAATRQVETKVGALRYRTVTERTFPGHCGYGIDLTHGPVVAITSITGDDAVDYPVTADELEYNPDDNVAYRLPYGAAFPLSGTARYDVVYTVGRDPIPENLMLAVMIVAEQLWLTQRGPVSTAKFSRSGGGEEDTPVLRGFAIPKRAIELMAPYRELIAV